MAGSPAEVSLVSAVPAVQTAGPGPRNIMRLQFVITTLLWLTLLVLGLSSVALQCELPMLFALMHLREALVHTGTFSGQPPRQNRWATTARLAAWGIAFVYVLTLGLHRESPHALSGAASGTITVLCGAIAVMWFVLERVVDVESRARTRNPDNRPIADWQTRFGTSLALRELSIAGVLIPAVVVLGARWQLLQTVARGTLLIWLAGLFAEGLLNAAFALCSGRAADDGLRRGSSLRLWLTGHSRPDDEDWLAATPLRTTGLASLGWRALGTLTIVLAGLGWVMTGLVIVRTHESAAYFRLGRLHPTPLMPGLHFVLPRPLGQVVYVPCNQVQTLAVGFRADIAELANLEFSWTRPHGRAEFPLIVGNGTELVALNGLVQFRVTTNPHAIRNFVVSSEDPRRILESLAHRVLTLETRTTSLDGILTDDRAEWNQRLLRRLASAADQLDLGVEILAFELVSVHPPIEVAAAYLDVVSARIDAERIVAETRAASVSEFRRCEMVSHTEIAEARGAAENRLSETEIELHEIESLSDADRIAPLVTRRRAYCDALSLELQRRPLTLIDAAIPPGTQVWKTLNSH